MNRVNTGTFLSARAISRVAMLSVIGFLLMLIEVPILFIAPEFIKMDISELPTLLGAFTMGPIYGVLICGLKNILHIVIRGTTTGGVGELSNFIIGSVFAFVSASIYRKNKTYKRAIIGLTSGVLIMTALSMVSNYYVIFPLYAKIIPMEAIIGMGSAVSEKVTDLWSFMVYCILPFNLLKGLITSALMMLVYKKLSPIFKLG